MLRFDEAASHYDLERTAMGYRVRHALVRSLLLEVCMRNNPALDLGCGTGEYAILMERLGFTVTGVDFSKAMLLIAKSKENLTYQISFNLLDQNALGFHSKRLV